MEAFVTEQLIFMTLAGSHMYGTNTPESDVDKRGVCVPPRKVVMGFARNFNQQEFPGEDTVVYALMKFMKLAVDANPNILELLFAPDDCVQTMHPTWEKLLERRDEFISAKCYHSLVGYAHSQLTRSATASTRSTNSWRSSMHWRARSRTPTIGCSRRRTRRSPRGANRAGRSVRSSPPGDVRLLCGSPRVPLDPPTPRGAHDERDRRTVQEGHHRQRRESLTGEVHGGHEAGGGPPLVAARRRAS